MSPDRGQGAGQSIEDAVVLAAAPATEPDRKAALRRYDALRRPRTQATADGARAVSPAAYRLMTTMIRLMPAALWRPTASKPRSVPCRAASSFRRSGSPHGRAPSDRPRRRPGRVMGTPSSPTPESSPSPTTAPPTREADNRRSSRMPS
ncbi:hypothetical protein [Spongiactinospora rosea]|uniref:hypothetical protein n=1 Tax=Spongiactinospora rosea TaxID=2248750 RepID=UPI00384A96CC